jgi:predicted nucleic acid-binding protein
MKAFLDTSVLVPVFYGDHVHHAASLELFTRFPKVLFTWNLLHYGQFGPEVMDILKTP